MHVFQSRFLRRGEVWFDQKPDRTAVDWIYYRQCPGRVPGAKWNYFHTLLVDLGNSSEELLKSFNQSTRHKIKRARDVDRFVCESPNPITPDLLDRFAKLYEPFAAHKGLGPLDRSRLEQLAKDGCLELSVVRDLNGTALVHHIYYRSAHRSCLMHSVSFHHSIGDSLARNAASRANCLLTWCDMLRHKTNGLTHFDFGGWYVGETDQARMDINRFKQGFGGTVVRECNCEQIITLKGRVVLALAPLVARAKLLAKSPGCLNKAPFNEPTRAARRPVPAKIDGTQPDQNKISPAIR
jgi:hypothetical protein